jgi:hypothetical protein
MQRPFSLGCYGAALVRLEQGHVERKKGVPIGPYLRGEKPADLSVVQPSSVHCQAGPAIVTLFRRISAFGTKRPFQP